MEALNNRTGAIERKTNETDIQLSIDLDGVGRRNIRQPVPFFGHMLDLFAKHSGFDLTIDATGDIEIDDHHTVEDIGICLGEAFRIAISDKSGIRRYGSRYVPMDESLAHVALDISGRPFLVFHATFGTEKIRTFHTELVEEFFRAFSSHAQVTLHINLAYGTNAHHMVEAIFKAFAGALSEAVRRDGTVRGVLSTKGML